MAKARGIGERYRRPPRLTPAQLRKQAHAVGAVPPIQSIPSVQTVPSIADTTVSSELEAFEERLAGMPAELQEAYRQGGIEGYNKAVEEYNRRVAGQQKAAQAEYERQIKEWQRKQAEYEARLAEAEATIKPSPEEEARLQQLRDAIALSQSPDIEEKIRKTGQDPAEYWASLEDIKRKLALAEQARQAQISWAASGKPVPSDVQKQLDLAKTMVYSKVAPFVKTQPDGSFTVDVEGAVSVGVGKKKLKELGVPDTDITRAKARKALLKYKRGSQYDLMRAIEGGDIAAVRALGITPNREIAGVSANEWRKLSADEQVGLTILGMQTGVGAKREWERTVLPVMPEEYQEAYAGEGFAGVQQLQQVSQAEFERWIKTEASPDLRVAYQRGGLPGYEKALQQNYVVLADGRRLPKWGKRTAGGELITVGFENLDKKYQDIGLQRGYSAMMAAIDADNQAQVDALKVLDRYKIDGNYDLSYALLDGIPRETMELAGFEPEDIGKAEAAYRASVETGVALPAQAKWLQKTLRDYRQAETALMRVTDATFARSDLTKAQKVQLVKQTPEYKNYVAVSKKLGDPLSQELKGVKRAAVLGTSMLLFAPARAVLPEVEIKDIQGVEWGIGALQLITIPLLPVKGAAIPLSVAWTGAMGARTVLGWQTMSPVERGTSIALTALAAIPLLGVGISKLAPGIKSVVIPTKTGDVVVWKGFTVNGKPVVGMSRRVGVAGETRVLRLGSGKPSLPRLAEIKPGTQPVTKLETSIIGTRRALREMGASASDIKWVETTLDTRRLFAGKRSPYRAKVVTLEDIKSLSSDGVGAVFRSYVQNSDKMQKIYGSYTIKQFLDPKLKAWRKLGDIDVMTKMSQKEAETFAQRLLAELRKTEGAGNVKIDLNNPTLIRAKGKDGTWRNAVDIHSKEVMPGSEPAAEGAWGMLHAENPVTVTLPGVGKLKFMRLSESGKRKAASITGMQTIKIGPAEHRVKDIADYYVILRTFKGQRVADDWARANGLVPDELMGVARENPLRLEAWELVPETGKPATSPIITVNLPRSLILNLSPALVSRIASPITLSPQALASVQANISNSLIPFMGSVRVPTSPECIVIDIRYFAPITCITVYSVPISKYVAFLVYLAVA